MAVLNLLRDTAYDGIDIRRYIRVRKSNYPHARLSYNPRAFCIILFLQSVAFSVDFDGETLRVAVEVNNEAAYDLLSAKLQSVKLVRSDSLPNHLLRDRHI